MKRDPRRLLKHYEAGALVRQDTVALLAEAAAHHLPESFVRDIPSDLLEDLRALSEKVPEPESVIVLNLGTFARHADRSAMDRESARDYVEGLWEWHRYFASNAADVDSHEPR